MILHSDLLKLFLGHLINLDKCCHTNLGQFFWRTKTKETSSPLVLITLSIESVMHSTTNKCNFVSLLIHNRLKFFLQVHSYFHAAALSRNLSPYHFMFRSCHFDMASNDRGEYNVENLKLSRQNHKNRKTHPKGDILSIFQ